MNYQVAESKKPEGIRNSNLILIGFATAFFPRLVSSFGIPSIINFAHFGIIPAFVGITLVTTRVRDRKQKAIAGDLSFGIGLFLACIITSALINEAGIVNVFLDFMLKAEPFIFLLAIMSVPIHGQNLVRVRKWLLGFAGFNLLLAIAQSILLPIGIYPKPEGGTLQDNITGVFGGGGGSAGNYVSCTVSFFFGIYFFNRFKTLPIWIRVAGLVGALYQTQVSDSKQSFLAFGAGWAFLLLTKVKKPGRLLLYLIPLVLIVFVFFWAVLNTDIQFLSPYRNWITREGLYGPDGEATLTKLAAFRIVPSYYKTPLNWLFGLGPGHSVSRLGGWVLRDYASLLLPLGATVHPSSLEVFQVVRDGWIAQESTIFFPLFTWAGIWGDLGIVGLITYLYLGFIIWRRICIDEFCKFLLLSTVVLGFILTQMEEPGHMLTVACLIGLRWHEEREKQLSKLTVQHFPEGDYNSYTNVFDNRQ